MSQTYDIAVVGGGLLGAANAWGLAKMGLKVLVLDEGDAVRRASRANFALVWVQGKGNSMGDYAHWSTLASQMWPQLAADLQAQTGLDVCYQRPGGFAFCMSEEEATRRAAANEKMLKMDLPQGYRMEMVSNEELRKLIPEVGPAVVAASYSPMDGHVNSLRAYRALHTGLHMFGAHYRPNCTVSKIDPQQGGGFTLHTSGGTFEAAKVLLTAGNVNQDLAPSLGLFAPMAPTRGQVIVTERVKPFLHYPINTIRQTDEGTVMIGDSKEDELNENRTRVPVSTKMADRARQAFPFLNRVNVVRTWSGVRVMTRDGYPIYDQSALYPGAFVACCHSGVTLASVHAYELARRIKEGDLSGPLAQTFTARRFADAPDTLLKTGGLA